MKQHYRYPTDLAPHKKGRRLNNATWRVKASLRWLAQALVLVLLNGCASVPPYAEFQATDAVLPEPAPGVTVDGRAHFRQIFCSVVGNQGVPPQQQGTNCDKLLWRLADEPTHIEADSSPSLSPKLQVLVVGGAFSDCFGSASVTFRDGIQRLVSAGHPISALAISGRSSAKFNAQMIAEGIQNSRDVPTVLLGYSKGAVDILHFLAEYPESAKRVVAVVSVAGPIMGSELAAYGDWAYDAFLTDTFADRCDPGDGGVLDSLLPQVRRDWLVDHPLPATVRFYSLLAFAAREHIAPALMPSWEILAAKDPRNDGQLTISDGTWPGSTLLGYANADHWGVAINIEEQLDSLAARPSDTRYPRSALFEAILRYVSEDLENRGVLQAAPGTAL